jgi:transposase
LDGSLGAPQIVVRHRRADMWHVTYPLSGHLFLFRNRRGDRLKILAWDRSGFWVLYKRLEQGTFAWPAEADTAPVEMQSADLWLLLSGTDLAHTRRRRWYERLA